MLFHADSTHMLVGSECFHKTVSIATGQDKGPGAPEIVIWEIALGSNGKSLWPGFSTITVS